MAAAANFSVRDALGGLALPRPLRDSDYLAPQPDLLAAALALVATMTAVLGTKVKRRGTKTWRIKHSRVTVDPPVHYTLSTGGVSGGRGGRGRVTRSTGDGCCDGPGWRRPAALDGSTGLSASRPARGKPLSV